MKVAFFTRAFSPSIGGIERIAEILAYEFSRCGHNVIVVTDTPARELTNIKQLFSVIRTQSLLCRLAAFRSCDAILFFNLSLIGLIPALLSGKPIIVSHHGIYEGRGFLAIILEWIKLKLTYFLPNISVSYFVAKHIPGISSVISNAYDSSLFIRNNTVIRTGDFVFCGRLVPEKGVLLCLEAFKLTLNTFPDARLAIIGSGTEAEIIEDFVLSNQIANQVAILGELSGHSLVEEVQQYSCLLVPSIWEEPFGIVALEGFACCDTVIATRKGGLPEVLDGFGILVEPDIKDLSAAMINVLDAKRKEIFLPGQPSDEERANYLARHTPFVVARQYIDVINKNI
jgi:glycosyltransferase involved in cell wall biosynthesis